MYTLISASVGPMCLRGNVSKASNTLLTTFVLLLVDA